MGTWCGDSKKWVPRFLKLWDAYELDRSKLRFTALYDTDEKYKQDPNGEELGKKIHRVPTFIFKRDGAEFARIVESPRNDLKTDLQQIALGVSSEPNYRGATYLIDVLEKMTASFNVESGGMPHLKGTTALVDVDPDVLNNAFKLENPMV